MSVFADRSIIAPSALVAVALIELVAHAWFARRAPRFDDYAVLREPVERIVQPRDAVVVTPRWAEPMVRGALGADLATVQAFAGAGHASADPAVGGTTSAIVDVAVAGYALPDRPGFEVASLASVPPFVVRRSVQPEAKPVVFDVVAALEPGIVSVRMGAGVRCMFNPLAGPRAGGLGGHPTWPRQRFVCPGLPHVTVGRTVIADRSWRPRQCVLAHPPPIGELAITYRNVDLGTTMAGHGGLPWMTERARRGAPIELRIEVDGTPIGSVIHADGDGWLPFELAVPEHLRSTADRHTVSFFVSSPGDRERDFCFEVHSL